MVISIETNHMEPHKIKKFMEGRGVNYETLAAQKQADIPNAYRVVSYPTVFLINPEGIIEQVELGFKKGRLEKLAKKTKVN